jgi:hypothetical protein
VQASAFEKAEQNNRGAGLLLPDKSKFEHLK